MNNRESARARDKKQRRRVLLDEKHENFMAALRKWEMLAAGTKVKISGSEEKKSKQEHIRHIKTTAKKCTKKCASRAKLFFFSNQTFFFLPFSLPSPFQVMLHGTICRTIFSATQRCIIVATLFRMVAALFQYCNTLFWVTALLALNDFIFCLSKF